MILGKIRINIGGAPACVLLAGLLAGCQAGPGQAAGETLPHAATEPTGAAAAASIGPYDKLGAVLWSQQAAEHRASALQAFAWARVMFDQAVSDPSWTAALEQEGDVTGLRPAVIVDVDETVLDNSPFQARMVKEQASFDRDAWNEWTREAQAGPVPGALEFARYVASRGGRMFYVTNRDASAEADTRKNLQALGFPLDAEVDTVLMRGERPQWSGDKTPRRAHVAKEHRVVLLIGDNLGDFAPASANKAPRAQRNQAATEDYRGYWGRKWIMIPNPMYGTWESAALEYQTPSSDSERVRRELGALDERRPAAAPGTSAASASGQ
jgi:acid phosphatase